MEDRKTVALSVTNDKKLAEIVKTTAWFTTDLDAYRLAVTLALAKGLDIKRESKGGKSETKYNVGSLDPDQSLKCLVETFAPESAERPYAHVQKLAEVGIQYLHACLVENGRSLSEVLTDEIK